MKVRVRKPFQILREAGRIADRCLAGVIPVLAAGVRGREGLAGKGGEVVALGVVDVKVAAIDDDWSGLRFVWRVANRSPL